MPTDQRAISQLDILIVEDNPFTAIVIGKTLESIGITRTMVAGDGREALAILDRDDARCDVIILDLRMPRMGGVEFLSRLADRKYASSVIVLSGVDEETLASVESLARKSDIRLLGTLPKPPDAQHVSDLLMQVAEAG